MAKKKPDPGVQDRIDLVSEMERFYYEPEAFVRYVLEANPDPWQQQALDAIAKHPRLSVRAGHGVGKTAFEAWIVLWFLFTRLFPKVPCTAPTRQQLLDVLWPEIAKWMERSPVLKQYFEWQKTRVVMVESPERWFATARTANKPENLAGFHEEDILFVVDEASGVHDQIFEVIEGALTTAGAKLLLCGNPTKTSGVFFDSHHRDRAMYKTFRVSCLDSPRVTPEYAERLAKKYGLDSDVYRVRVAGEFPKGDPSTFIALSWVEGAILRDLYEIDERGRLLVPHTAPLDIGVDVARFGDDETAIAGRIGAKQVRMEGFHGQNLMKTVGETMIMARELMEEFSRPRIRIKIDDDGLGGGVTDRIREVIKEEDLMDQIQVIPCRNGAAPKTEKGKKHYANWGGEAWGHVRDLLKGDDGEVIQLLDDEKLVGQLSTRKYEINSKGLIVLESKKEMKRRGLESPDRADAVVLAFAENVDGVAVDPEIRKLFQGVSLHG